MSRNIIRGDNAAAIADSIEGAFQSGKLAPGERLPAIRDLASTLRVSPVTVASAYRLLRGRGLASGSGRRGTALRADTLSGHVAASRSRAISAHVDLATGNPDPSLLPLLGPALRSIDPDTRLYGGPLDSSALVAFAAGEFAADGIAEGPVAVTSGSLDAIERLLREHARAGDAIAVEDPTFPALLDLLSSLGLVPAPFAIDDDGPRAEALERAVGPRVPVVVISSRAQNPAGAAISETRAADLRRVLRQRPRALLIEIDDSAAVSGAPLVTLTTGRERWAVVRSTSKWLGPDLRLAVTTGDAITIGRVQRRQAVNVRWVSHLLQHLALALWSDPSNGRLFARAAEIYAERRRALIEALAAHEIRAQGRSGFNVWIPVREETSTVQTLAERGWAVAAGERFRVQSPPAIRVTTSALRPAEATRFAADLAATVRQRGSVPA
ncbi:MAG TPA: aminotransferase class I/II-fold pyridoxal phosphate-dependent enzyme [Vicinamibacterales bacterium]|nr:aminotransferase class I/II-fold pyridoxal phosphate-dependent enzyme [Vicinamibacterales bacterium]